MAIPREPPDLIPFLEFLLFMLPVIPHLATTRCHVGSELEAEAGMSAESCKEGIAVVPVRAEVGSDHGGGSGDRVGKILYRVWRWSQWDQEMGWL